MDTQWLVDRLEREWDLEQGFLGKLRLGMIDDSAFIHLKEPLVSIDFKDEIVVHRRVISLLWYVPLFMNWQRDRFADDNQKLQFLDRATNEVTSILEDVLGVP